MPRTRLGCAFTAALATLILAGAATSGPHARLVAPGALLDQSYPQRPSACRFTAWAPDDGASWAAQTFTAGISGGLTDVVLPLRSRISPVVVAIAPTDAAGRPAVGAPLAVTTLALAEAATYVDTPISFVPPPRIRSGGQYAIVLSAPGTDAAANAFAAWKADLGATVADPTGTPCGDGTYAPGRAWVSGDGLGSGADFFFQTFVRPARRLTVVTTGTGAGTVEGAEGLACGYSTCSGEFLEGETVTLTATPAPGSTFAGWSGGGCNGDAPTCSIVVSTNAIVFARFTPTLVDLRVRTIGAGTVTGRSAGIRCGTRCSRDVPVGSQVTLAAKPARGWRFARWSGACRGTRPLCRVTVSPTTVVTAVFSRSSRPRQSRSWWSRDAHRQGEE